MENTEVKLDTTDIDMGSDIEDQSNNGPIMSEDEQRAQMQAAKDWLASLKPEVC